MINQRSNKPFIFFVSSVTYHKIMTDVYHKTHSGSSIEASCAARPKIASLSGGGSAACLAV